VTLIVSPIMRSTRETHSRDGMESSSGSS
jgi:hypothetical protein